MAGSACTVRVSTGGAPPVVQAGCPCGPFSKGIAVETIEPPMASPALARLGKGFARLGDSGPDGGQARHNADTKGGRLGGGKAGGRQTRHHGSYCQPFDRMVTAVGKRDTRFDCFERVSNSHGRRQIYKMPGTAVQET